MGIAAFHDDIGIVIGGNSGIKVTIVKPVNCNLLAEINLVFFTVC
jgi:hypothetical protein